jgi:hypothetical protein
MCKIVLVYWRKLSSLSRIFLNQHRNSGIADVPRHCSGESMPKKLDATKQPKHRKKFPGVS